MFINISVIDDTEHANAGALRLFSNRQVEESNEEFLKQAVRYTVKIFKTIYKNYLFSNIYFLYTDAHLKEKIQSTVRNSACEANSEMFCKSG